MSVVPSRVAIVIPEIGFDDEPMSPTMRDDTATKKNPNTSTRRAGQEIAGECTVRDARQHRDDDRQYDGAGEHPGDRHVAIGALDGDHAAARLPQVAHRVAHRAEDDGQCAHQRHDAGHGTAPAPM
jgi:hypothetical protein